MDTHPRTEPRPPRLPTTRVPCRSPLPAGTVLAAGLLVGLAGDLLLRAPGVPGLDVFLLFLGLALAIVVVSRRTGLVLSRESVAWLATGVLFGVAIMLRAAPALQLLTLLAAAAAFALPALRAGRAWMRGSGVSDPLEAIAGALGYSGLGALRMVAEGLSRRSSVRPLETTERHPVPGVLRGLALGAPFLLVFGALFMSADRVFARLVTDLVSVDVEEVASHVVLTGLLAWLTSGYLVGFLAGTRTRQLLEGWTPRPTLGILEVGTALALVDFLFAAFVAVQFRYLFGGSGLVEVTPGLTYAEYTRQGFAQLALASALVLPSLLAADWLLRDELPVAKRIFRGLGGLLLLLLSAVIGSALQRVWAYQEAYGLTESRFYGVAFLGWLTVLGAWFAVTILRGRRDRFAVPALMSAFTVVALLLVANPDVWIARTNLARTGLGSAAVATPAPATDRGSATPRPVDAAYLASLSADAVPTLVGALPRLPAEARCTLARGLLRRWGPERRVDWRSWNRSAARARNVVRLESAELRSMVPHAGEGDCS
ncbi:MAG TPA: DUF4173 domain-containing protein [Longimicrobiales bacterium]|nr:DUF4173 domain-containing protein [Longimicrobiales bacterium]